MPVDYSKLAFTSSLRYERVILKGHVDFSIPGAFGITTATITHNLGYIPFFKLYYLYDSAGNIFPLFSGPVSFNINGNNCQVDDVTATSTTITADLENLNASPTPITGKIYYRIYKESGA